MKRIQTLLVCASSLFVVAACDAPNEMEISAEALEAQTDQDLQSAEALINPDAAEPADEDVVDDSEVPQGTSDALVNNTQPLAGRSNECLQDNQCPSGQRCEGFPVGAELSGGTCVSTCNDWTDCDFAEECGNDGYCSLLFNGDWDYCRQGGCERGEGDCDANADCVGSLACIQNNGSAWGMSPNRDVCDYPAGHGNYCSSQFPCASNQGDCDSASDCNFGLKCVSNIGADYGFASWVDICKPFWWF